MHKVSLGFCRTSLGKTGPEKVAFRTCVLFFFFFFFAFVFWVGKWAWHCGRCCSHINVAKIYVFWFCLLVSLKVDVR